MIRHSRRTRVLLSLFFLLHFGAVLAYVGPAEPDSLERLPEPLRTPLQAVAPPLVRAAWPVARPYLDLTGARQHWSLFAPDPAAWAASVEVVAYYPAGGAGDEAAGGRPGTRPARAWTADTVLLRGPREVPYPHLVDHRSFRVLYNLGYEGWGAFYRPIFARHLCRTLREEGSGRRPVGVALTSIWEHTRVWWRDPADEPGLYRQPLGGYDCRAPGDEPSARAGAGDGGSVVEADGGAGGGEGGG